MNGTVVVKSICVRFQPGIHDSTSLEVKGYFCQNVRQKCLFPKITLLAQCSTKYVGEEACDDVNIEKDLDKFVLSLQNGLDENNSQEISYSYSTFSNS